MKSHLYFFLFTFCILSCYKELPDIEPILLHNAEIPLFEIDSVSVLSDTAELNVRVFYSTKYFELTEQQQERARFTRIFKNREQIHSEYMYILNEDLDYVLYFDDTIEPGIVCYGFFFSGSRLFTGGLPNGYIKQKSREIELCIDI